MINEVYIFVRVCDLYVQNFSFLEFEVIFLSLVVCMSWRAKLHFFTVYGVWAIRGKLRTAHLLAQGLWLMIGEVLLSLDSGWYSSLWGIWGLLEEVRLFEAPKIEQNLRHRSIGVVLRQRIAILTADIVRVWLVPNNFECLFCVWFHENRQ